MTSSSLLDRLHKDSREVIDGLQDLGDLELGIKGMGKDAVVATSRRVIVLSGREAASYSYDELSGVDHNFGVIFSWLALRGPKLVADKPEPASVGKMPSAVALAGKDARDDIARLEELISATGKAAGMGHLIVAYARMPATARDE